MGPVETARSLAQELFSGSDAQVPITEFPSNAWERFGVEGLLGLSAPKAFGGTGLDAPALFRVGEALVDGGCSLGFALSWLIHNLTARHVLADHGGDGQREAHLASIVSGKSSIALAVSEPGMHGSPKKLDAQARKVDGGYEITGEKVYLTNGPIADLYVVIAVEGQEGARKSFGAFLVGRDNSGISVENMDVGALAPSPHAQLSLKNCFVPTEDRLSPSGDAFEHLVKPFGFFERVLLLGPTLGAMKGLLGGLAEGLAEKGQRCDETAEKLGHLVLLCDEVEVLGGEASRIVEEEAGRLSPLPSSMAAWAACRSFIERFMALIDQTGFGAIV